MGTILIIIVVILLLGGGGGYYAHGRYGGTGLGGVLGLVVLIFVLLWLFGASAAPAGSNLAPEICSRDLCGLSI